ncbi:MAG: DUF4097 family beta strand repeat protein [Acidobacteria bacterium]|nr:DUF4097 family beta strand repeat protein [Acidobacteriota bacterium]
MKYPPLVPVFALGLGLFPSTGCVVAVDSHSEIVREEKRFTVKGTPDVRVATFDGSIQIQGWDKPGILVEIEKRGPSKEAVDGLQVVVEQTGDLIDLEVKRPKNESFSRIGIEHTAYARLVVSVPRSANIRARSGDGPIRIDRVSGRIELRTGDGSIRASEVSGDMNFDTGDGSVVVEAAQGQLVVETGDGSVNVSGNLGAVTLHTGDGSVVYRAEPGSSMTNAWDITTGDGSVTLYLPRDFGADVDAHTGDGRIVSDLGEPIERTDGDRERRERDRRTLRGPIGGGGQLLRVRSGDGAIRLKLN